MVSTKQLLSAAAVLGLMTSTANAVPVQIHFDTFEGMSSSGISADAAQEAASAWTDATNEYDALNTPIANYNQNARTDVSGNGSSKGMRVRSSTGAAVLDAPLQLATLGATSFTISYDINLDDDSVFEIGLFYTDNNAFTGAHQITSWASDGTPNGGWFSESWTLNDGDNGITFNDNIQIMIGRLSRGGGANSTFHSFDNIEISYEAAPIPEPSSLALIGIGGLLVARRRRG